MPHQCTDCGRAFDDGSKQMLSGCPDCGGNKFQYRPAGDEEPSTAEESPEPPEPPVDSSVARTVGSAATAVRDLVSGGSAPPNTDDASAGAPEADQKTPKTDPQENSAQASARTDVVPKEELPPAPDRPPAAPEPTPTDAGESRDDDSGERDRPDLSELRAELNDQFESIKVLSPGHYELNLMELYDREEYIIALQEDGKYTIQVPERWAQS